MTLGEVYRQTKRRLVEAGVEDAPVEAAILMEHFFGLSRAQLFLRDKEAPSAEALHRLETAVAQRVTRRPLQYILGEWAFMGLTLSVGEGVLVPREDTGVLVEAVAAYIQGNPRAVGVDLCAGTGAVALAVCSENPRAAVTAVELSGAAFGFLMENLRRYPRLQITPMQGDITDPSLQQRFPAGSLDFIAANPPYIESAELPLLQAEVKKEPAMALDGGGDGLGFYRVLAGQWRSRLRPGGLLAVEIGETQGAAVKKLFAENGFATVQSIKDMAGLDRVVTGIYGQ